jgi:hypothetical protein
MHTRLASLVAKREILPSRGRDGCKYSFELAPRDDVNSTTELLGVFETDFQDVVGEIETAICGGTHCHPTDGTFSYSAAFTPVVRNIDTGVIASAAIVCERNIRKGKVNSRVWDVIWVNSIESAKGSGAGTILIDQLHELAKEDNVTAIVVESSSKALTYWTTRGFPTLRCLLRRGPHGQPIDGQEMCKRASEDACRSAIADALLLPQSNSDVQQASPSKKKKGKKKGPAGPEALFTVLPIPPIEVEVLYNERVFRDARGRPSTSASFSGNGYRYDITGSTHVIFPIDATFTAKCKGSGLVVTHNKDALAHFRELGRRLKEQTSTPTKANAEQHVCESAQLSPVKVTDIAAHLATACTLTYSNEDAVANDDEMQPYELDQSAPKRIGRKGSTESVLMMLQTWLTNNAEAEAAP